jgi:hypothetical protein
MTARIFDRETLLDLVVNGIPLFILLFFLAAFAVVDPFGFDPLASGLQFALVAVPFVLLAVLTYVSARAIAGDEAEGSVAPPGQSTVPEATAESHGDAADAAGDDGSDPDPDPAPGP